MVMLKLEMLAYGAVVPGHDENGEFIGVPQATPALKEEAFFNGFEPFNTELIMGYIIK